MRSQCKVVCCIAYGCPLSGSACEYIPLHIATVERCLVSRFSRSFFGPHTHLGTCNQCNVVHCIAYGCPLSGSACGCISLHFASVERCLVSSSKYTIFWSFFRPYFNDWSTITTITRFQNPYITKILLKRFFLYSWHLKIIFKRFNASTFIKTMEQTVQIIRMMAWLRSET